MPFHSRPFLRRGTTVLTGLVLLTACGTPGGGPEVAAPMAATATTSMAATATAPNAATATAPTADPVLPTVGAAPSTTSATGDGTTTVPIALVSNSGDQAYLTAQVSIGGGAPATVWLDTGSSGLLVDAAAVGPAVTTSTTPVGIDYTSGALVGSIATATVEIGGVATAQPVAFALLDASKSTFTTPPGTVGILGIGTDDDSDVATQQIFAPQLQLPAPYNEGSTVQVSAAGTGSWILGPVATTDGQIAAPLSPNTSSAAGVPTGYPALLRPVDLCWTIATAAATCAPTDLDTGSPSTILSATDYTGLAASGELLPEPTAVRVTTPGEAEIWSFTSGTSYAEDTVGVADIGSNRFNTGLGFFVGRSVAWDYTGSRILISATA